MVLDKEGEILETSVKPRLTLRKAFDEKIIKPLNNYAETQAKLRKQVRLALVCTLA
jgi:hypothetical protein